MTSKESLVTISDEAKAEIIRLLAGEPESHGLRLGIKGGGCSGLSYDFLTIYSREIPPFQI